jgi:hypothetical protein
VVFIDDFEAAKDRVGQIVSLEFLQGRDLLRDGTLKLRAIENSNQFRSRSNGGSRAVGRSPVWRNPALSASKQD